jgi:hypothetical protein
MIWHDVGIVLHWMIVVTICAMLAALVGTVIFGWACIVLDWLNRP